MPTFRPKSSLNRWHNHRSGISDDGPKSVVVESRLPPASMIWIAGPDKSNVFIAFREFRDVARIPINGFLTATSMCNALNLIERQM
jgi:hypothetical protein